LKNHSRQEFKAIQRLASLLAKEYAEDFLRLLVIYKNISASEAAARLGLHIKTQPHCRSAYLYGGRPQPGRKTS